MMRTLVLVAVATILMQLKTTSAEKFSCEGRGSGYYADVDTGCQVYHMCDGLGRQFSYSCPNTTLFQQRMLICDHWYMVNCSKSEHDYSANLLIGQRDKPFVEDSSEHPYHRTPRPDLLQQPYAPRYQDEDYRKGKAQSLPSAVHNLVGVATEDDAEDELGHRRNFSTDRPQYFLPSHWSTEYGKGLTTPLPPLVKINNVKVFKQSTTTSNGKIPIVPSGKLPPLSFNYDPKYYKVPSSQNNNKLNTINRADFPDAINEESASPSSLALPPFAPRGTIKPPRFIANESSNIITPSIYYQPPKLSTFFNAETTTMDPRTFSKLIPSKNLLPPGVQSQIPPLRPSNPPPQLTTSTVRTINKKDTTEDSKTSSSISEKRWKELRQMFFIPEYDFPLEVGSRPSYEGGLSSFQVNPAPPNPELRPPEANPMRFPEASSSVNPECPKCDPDFLVPGTCKPCVMIRR